MSLKGQQALSNNYNVTVKALISREGSAYAHNAMECHSNIDKKGLCIQKPKYKVAAFEFMNETSFHPLPI